MPRDQRKFSNAFIRHAERLLPERSGNVGMMFALGLVPILLAVSIAIDFTRASDEKARMDSAIDAAVLYATTAAAANANASSYEDQQMAAQRYFTSALGPLRNGVSVASISVKVAKDPNNKSNLISTASYSGSITTMFGNLFKPAIAFSGTASASMQIPTYIDFYLLLDNSPSMGLASTPADIAKMVAATPDRCEFACHVVDKFGNSDPNDYLSIAIRNDVRLRIDELRDATEALTQTAKATQAKSGLANQFRMGVYGFYSDVTVYSTKNGHDSNSRGNDAGLTADLDLARNAASSLQLTPYKSDNNYFLTNFVETMKSIDKIVSDPGDGSKSSTPEKYVFFVTDGVQDLPLNHPDGSKDPKYTQYDDTAKWGHAIAPIDPTICQPLKNRGVKIAVLYTPFLATSAGVSPLSDQDIIYWENDIPQKLTECASQGLFYKADSRGIAAAMNQMFQDVLRSARLTR